MISSILQQLEAIGQRVARWRAELFATWGLAIVLGVLWVLGMADFWLRLGRTDRIVVWCVLVSLTLGLLWKVTAEKRRRFTPRVSPR